MEAQKVKDSLNPFQVEVRRDRQCDRRQDLELGVGDRQLTRGTDEVHSPQALPAASASRAAWDAGCVPTRTFSLMGNPLLINALLFIPPNQASGLKKGADAHWTV